MFLSLHCNNGGSLRYLVACDSFVTQKFLGTEASQLNHFSDKFKSLKYVVKSVIFLFLNDNKSYNVFLKLCHVLLISL